jgi:hypothetical protein
MSPHALGVEASSSLRPGDWVEVRSKEEILATLDREGRLDGLHFMPEMFAYCGQRLQVYKRAHKTCDTIDRTGGRRMNNAVHLDDVRCDGAAHGGCEAACLIFWKDAWLKPVAEPHAANGSNGMRPPIEAPDPSGRGCTEADVVAATREKGQPQGPNDEPVYACQATKLLEASKPLPWWDARQYVEDYRSGNSGVGEILRGALYVAAFNTINLSRRLGRKIHFDISERLTAVYDFVQKQIGGVPFPRRGGLVPAGQKTPAVVTNLQPGELVRIKPYKEILATLDDDSKNRGLYFDAEHVPYCGSVRRVRSTVGKIIDEKTGKMLVFKNKSIILEGAICQAHYSDRRMFCPRALYPYWREIWLERVEPAPAAVTQGGAGATAGASGPPGPVPVMTKQGS